MAKIWSIAKSWKIRASSDVVGTSPLLNSINLCLFLDEAYGGA